MSKKLLLFITLITFIFSKLPEDFSKTSNEPSKVYYTPEISPEAIGKLYDKLGVKLGEKVALKVHSGEIGGKYFLTPKFLKPFQDKMKGTFVECNTAYGEGRINTTQHNITAKANGWLDDGIKFQILDEHPQNDFNLTIDYGEQIKENIVGEHLKDYDSCVVLSHFKGHPMGGFGGALKQLSIGFGSTAGKAYIHSGGRTVDPAKKSEGVSQEEFTAAMADSAASIHKYFNEGEGKKGIVYISVVANISLWCDCGGPRSPPPKIKDIGILASTDPVAIDQAALNLIKERGESLEPEGRAELFEQIEKKKGENTVIVAEKHGIGSRNYELIELEPRPKAKVYFNSVISKENVLELYKKLGVTLGGKVALKIHSGEVGGKYFLNPSFLKPIHDETKGTFVECNTAYARTDGAPGRFYTEQHMQTAKANGWIQDDIRFQILDEKVENDDTLEINPHKVIPTNIVGEHLKEYDSCVVLSHLKGHVMGGFGGALKQLSIGFASRNGKANIHSSGKIKDATNPELFKGDQYNFTRSMADAASSIVRYFKEKDKGGIVYINVIANISTGCDCMGPKAQEPHIKDIGILASTDPVAIDRASLDLIQFKGIGITETGISEWFKQLEEKMGNNTVNVAEELGVGTTSYELIDVSPTPTPSPSPSPSPSPIPPKTFAKYLKSTFIGVILTLILF